MTFKEGFKLGAGVYLGYAVAKTLSEIPESVLNMFLKTIFDDIKGDLKDKLPNDTYLEMERKYSREALDKKIAKRTRTTVMGFKG